jgi:hypothetical protein
MTVFMKKSQITIAMPIFYYPVKNREVIMIDYNLIDKREFA